MKKPFDLDLNGVRMAAQTADTSGAVSSATIMIFEQANGIISARYCGGAILDGYLIGHLRGLSLHFRYVQAQDDGRLDAGVSNGDLDRLPDGRLRLTEHFRWLTRPGRGTNIFEELSPRNR